MNRHHYTLYVHNCRLVFLFRQDPAQGKTYQPAEFHWKLNQVSLQGSAGVLEPPVTDIPGSVLSDKHFLPLQTPDSLFYRAQQCLLHLGSSGRFSCTFSS